MMDEDYIPLSALQHAMFCPRQCALIHRDALWRENALTTMGKLEHQRVDEGRDSRCGDRLTARSIHLVSHRLLIHGLSDVVEYQYAPNSERIESIYPIEYKHGQEKLHQADAVQLCAQVLCLEEMYGLDIKQAYLFYQSTRRRLEVVMDDSLRRLTEDCIKKTRALLSSPKLPAAQRQSSCESCSLESDCLPLKSTKAASEYNLRAFALSDN